MDQHVLTKSLRFINLAAALALAATPAVAGTWDFFETSIACTPSGTFSGCSLDSGPIAEFSVPGDNSTGSASWFSGFPIMPGDSSPTHTGDDFVLQLRGQEITSRDLMGMITFGRLSLRQYDISWDVADGIMNTVHIYYQTHTDEVNLFLTHGSIASDIELGGCVWTQCQVTGEWVDFPFAPANVPVPEPEALPLVLLAVGFFGLMAVGRLRQPWQR